MSDLVAKAVNVKAEDVVVASTGVIGQPLDITPIANGMAQLVSELSYEGNVAAAQAIMTTDTVPKEVAVEFEIGGKTCRMGGIAKGSGMIHPNMATMLVFITTDVKIAPAMLEKALKADVPETFNMVSVDGDTSTNDMVSILANGMADNDEITCEGEAFDTFAKALNTVTVALCQMIAGDGEGATKLLEVHIDGASTHEAAKKIAKSIICSSLVKTAMFGADANWGRILCAIGYSGEQVDVLGVDVYFKSCKGDICVCQKGSSIDFSEEKAKEILLEKEIEIIVKLSDGDGKATAWGCDLTYEYVKINGDYRT